MIPLFDDNPTRRVPWVTASLIAANVAVFVYMLFLKGTNLDIFIYRYSVVPWEITHGRILPALAMAGIGKNIYLPLLTSMFLHSGWLHIGGNMLFLWIFGNNIEDLMGPLPYLVFYLVCGFAATFTHIAFNAQSQNPLLGASGAIAGILAAYLIMYPRARVHTIVVIVLVTLPAFVVIGFWIVLQVISGVTTIHSATGGGTAWFAHLGGIGAGTILTGIFYVPLKRRRAPAPAGEIHRFFQPRGEFNRPWPPQGGGRQWPPRGSWPPPSGGTAWLPPGNRELPPDEEDDA